MQVDAITKLTNIDQKMRRIDVFSPKYPHGQSVIALSDQYLGRPVKLVTSWSDIKVVTPVTINGGIIDDGLAGMCTLYRGMYITSFGDDTIYVVVPEMMIK